MDIQVFSGNWDLSGGNVENGAAGAVVGALESTALPLDLQSAYWLVNFLVLSFLFGERAMKNVLPLLQQRAGGSVNVTSNNGAQG